VFARSHRAPVPLSQTGFSSLAAPLRPTAAPSRFRRRAPVGSRGEGLRRGARPESEWWLSRTEACLTTTQRAAFLHGSPPFPPPEARAGRPHTRKRVACARGCRISELRGCCKPASCGSDKVQPRLRLARPVGRPLPDPVARFLEVQDQRQHSPVRRLRSRARGSRCSLLRVQSAPAPSPWRPPRAPPDRLRRRLRAPLRRACSWPASHQLPEQGLAPLAPGRPAAPLPLRWRAPPPSRAQQ